MLNNLDSIGFVIHTLGELMVAFTVLRVHGQVVRDHKLDKKVFTQMRLEQWLGMAGVTCIILGFVLELLA